MTLGEHTLSECQDKEIRASKEFWVERVKQAGIYKSAYLHTPQIWVDEFTERQKEIIREHVRYKDVLEIGCGYGRLLPAFEECGSYVGIDFVPELIEEAQKNLLEYSKKTNRTYSNRFVCLNLRDLKPGIFDSFDIVVGVSVITSVEYQFPKVLEILKAVLQPNGYILWIEEDWMRIDWKR